MRCRAAVMVSVFLSAVLAHGQVLQSPAKSDALAVSLAQKSMAALTGGSVLSDVTLTADVTSIHGNSETGTATFEGKGTGESRVDLNLNNVTRSDVRNFSNNVPAGSWERNGTSVSYAQHNCWTSAVWFFPALSSLAQTTNPNFVFKYLGREQHDGLDTLHIRVYQLPTQDQLPLIAQLSTTDFYLDYTSSLPYSISFNIHPDDDMGKDIPAEIDFREYQSFGGIQVPLHFQRKLNGGVLLDVSVTDVVLNSGLLDNLFTVQ